MLERVIGGGLFLAGCAAFAQAPAPPPAFDVASIKPSQLALTGGEGSRREHVQATPGSLTLQNVTLAVCIEYAYKIKDLNVFGPAWIRELRYDIAAKAGDAADTERLRLMLQTLLATRFQVESHRETREIPVYALTPAKGGVKVHPSATDGEFEQKPGPNGKMNIELHHVSMAQFADFLSGSPLQRPVLDETGLAGKYDLKLDLMPYLDSGPNGKLEGPIGVSDAANMIAMAVQDQLGLKLESKKAPMEVIVVDRAEKTPAEN